MKAQVAPTIRRSRAADLPAVGRLLSDARLAAADLSSAPDLRCWVLEAGGELVGVIGLECAASGALVRSLTVVPAYRGQGWARELLRTAEREARALGIRQLVLLTETAQAFFVAHGYGVIERADVPEELQRTAQFRSLCPAAAICLGKSLETVSG